MRRTSRRFLRQPVPELFVILSPLSPSASSCPRCKLRSSLATLQQLCRPSIHPPASASFSTSCATFRPTSRALLTTLHRSSNSSSTGVCASDARHTTVAAARFQTRPASTVASATAVNAQKHIRPELKGLHSALETVGKVAVNYINISRLKLALLSLERRDPVIRVAILGLQGPQPARQLARLLVADPTVRDEAWEKQFDVLQQQDTRAIVLRYGSNADELVSSAQASVVHVPSPFLQEHNLEILISSLNLPLSGPVTPADAQNFKRAALVPTAEIANSFSGAVSWTTYPVHQTIVVADGLAGCFSLGKYAGKSSTKRAIQSPLMFAVNLPLPPAQESAAYQHNIDSLALVDILQAQKALSKIQRLAWNQEKFQESLLVTGLSKLSTWMRSDIKSKNLILDASIGRLTFDMLDEAEQKIDADIRSLEPIPTRHSGLDEARISLESTLQQWASRAHTELREELNAAFSSSNWAKLKWWKLPWRVDDIDMIVTELLERNWLPESEKALIWLSGRCSEAGFVVQSQIAHEQIADGHLSGGAEAASLGATTHPWPESIHNTRAYLKQSSVPPLQALAQALLLQTFNIAAMSSALSLLIFAAIPAASILNAGSIAAFGFVWSLRRAQKTWEEERLQFEDEARERGRLILKETEAKMRATILSGVQDAATAIDPNSPPGKAALQAVQLARNELLQVNGK